MDKKRGEEFQKEGARILDDYLFIVTAKLQTERKLKINKILKLFVWI